MQNIQNLQNNTQHRVSPTPQHQEQQNYSRQKSFAKFNRKSPSNVVQKKKKNDHSKQNQQHRLVYISPAKNITNITHNKTNPTVPTFTDVMNRFTISNDQLFDFKPKESINSNHLHLCESQVCRRTLQAKKREIKYLKQKLEKGKEQIICISQKNKELKIKCNNLQDIHIFLIERETFISQILESNINLNESIQKVQNQKLLMAEHFGVLLQQKLDCERQYEKQYIEWNKILQEKNNQITRLLTTNNRNQLTPKTKSSKQHLSQTYKENIPKINEQQQNKQGRKCNVGQVEFTCHDPNLSSPKHGNDASEKQWMRQRQNLQKMIKQLQQRIKYGNIEMDILKKQKQDSSKLSITNQTLKKQNRKLLHRLHILTRTFNRNSNNSDSSLELSLSPKHH